jgi:hypothetical protein
MYGKLGRLAPALVREIRTLRRNSTEVSELVEASGTGLFLGKGWHFLHFAITGVAWGGEPPLSWAVHGDAHVGGDLGNGPARFLNGRQVKEVAEELELLKLEPAPPWLTCKALTANEVYPNCWETFAPEHLQGWLDDAVKQLEQLKALYRTAAKNTECVISMIS